ncbi:MAG: HAD family hydrolase [Verrucomicrobia bacterium]|nr:HAD family hydrolase [Verrucomicrobiota bacterium]
MKSRAVFLDRDGTLIEERNYLHRPEDVSFFPGAIEAMRRLSAAGYRLLMVTNQSGVGRGYFTMDDVTRVHAHMAAVLAPHGIVFDEFYVAPEAPDQPSRGRKPAPAFLWDARAAFNLDLAESYMVGDKLIDLECGWNAGVKASILVRTGYGEQVSRSAGERLKGAIIAEGLVQAADYILR